MKSVEDYHKGFLDGMNANVKYPMLLMVAGYKFEKILDLVLKDQEKAMAKSVDWNKPLQITTKNGTFKVYNLGIGWKDRRLVQIEECSIRFPSHDGTLPNVFAPDENGYVVQFDSYIENVSLTKRTNTR